MKMFKTLFIFIEFEINLVEQSKLQIKPEIVDTAITSISGDDFPKYYLSPRGVKFNQNIAAP